VAPAERLGAHAEHRAQGGRVADDGHAHGPAAEPDDRAVLGPELVEDRLGVLEDPSEEPGLPRQRRVGQRAGVDDGGDHPDLLAGCEHPRAS
jgi:hypothetical protein